MTLWFICLPVAAYLFGSVSFAWIAGRLRGIDLREHGSGNLGATNAGRVLGLRWFAIVFCCDVAKGLLPVVAAQQLPALVGVSPSGLQDQALQLATAIAAILGHVFTFFHGFKGGKAVATSLGVLIGLLPLLAAALAGIWLLIWLAAAFIGRMKKSSAVAPASVLAALAAVPVHLLLSDGPAFGDDRVLLSCFVCLLALVVVGRHHSNIRAMLGRPPETPAPGSHGPS